jgi:hypothetical protein
VLYIRKVRSDGDRPPAHLIEELLPGLVLDLEITTFFFFQALSVEPADTPAQPRIRDGAPFCQVNEKC